MKEFRCGEIVPGCETVFEAESEEQILREVAEHAREEHGMDEVPPEVAGPGPRQHLGALAPAGRGRRRTAGPGRRHARVARAPVLGYVRTMTIGPAGRPVPVPA